MALHQQVHNLVYRQPAHPRHSHPSSLAPQTHPSPRRVRENAPSPSVSLQVKARVEDENPWPEPDHTPMFSRRQKSNDTPVTQHVVSYHSLPAVAHHSTRLLVGRVRSTKYLPPIRRTGHILTHRFIPSAPLILQLLSLSSLLQPFRPLLPYLG